MGQAGPGSLRLRCPGMEGSPGFLARAGRAGVARGRALVLTLGLLGALLLVIAEFSTVASVQIPGRTHNTIWSKVAEDGDETAGRIVEFVRSTTARTASSR